MKSTVKNIRNNNNEHNFFYIDHDFEIRLKLLILNVKRYMRRLFFYLYKKSYFIFEKT